MNQFTRLITRCVMICIVLLGISACEDKKPPATQKVEKTMPATEAKPSDMAESSADASANENDASATSMPTTPASSDSMNAAKEAEQTIAANEPAVSTTSDAADSSQQSNLVLARKSGCLACHQVDKKMVGPAWKDVAARYKGNPKAKSRLIEKVSKGGRGNWTDVVGNVAMPPYSPRVSQENIEKLVEFVLGLE